MNPRVASTIAFLGGLLAPYQSFEQWLFGLLSLALLCVWQPKLLIRSTLLAMISLYALGFLRTSLDHTGDAWFPPQTSQEFAGTIVEPPRAWGSSSVFFFLVDQVGDSVLDSPCKVLVQWSHCDQNLAPGDRWALIGRWKEGEAQNYPGGYSQKDWLWGQRAEGVLQLSRFSHYRYLSPPRGYSLYQLSWRARAAMIRKLAALPDASSRALVTGVVFGETQSLPKELEEQFRRTGTSHLLAASGANVCLLAGLVFWVGTRLGYGPWRLAPVAAPLAIAYCFLAGCAPSITRATVGLCFCLLASYLGRQSSPWNTLCLSLLLLLAWEPRQIYDVGFQLSVGAVLGLLARPKFLENQSSFGESLSLTLSASVFTLPVVWYSFGTLSTTLLPANLILTPVVELLFPLGLLFSMIGCAPLGWLVDGLARISAFLVQHLSQFGDPLELAHPSSLCFLLLTAVLWAWPKSQCRLHLIGCLSAIICTLSLNQCLSALPQVHGTEIRVIRIGVKEPIYWISTQDEERLFLSEEWQKKRARSMLLRCHCSRRATVELLEPGEQPLVPGLNWASVSPYLAAAPYIEVRFKGNSYTVLPWFPKKDGNDFRRTK